MEGVRINRYLADGGLGSRRQVESFVAAGEVAINGELVVDLSRRVLPEDEVLCRGQLVSASPSKEIQDSDVWMYHKPRSLLCTRTDPEGRPTIWEDLAHLPPPFQAVGRLDQDSSGLLLITRDGQLSNLLMHPRHEVSKTYEVRAHGQWTKGMRTQLSAGVKMKEGGMGQAEVIRAVPQGSRVDLKLLLKHGKKREIRYSLEALGLEVELLHRVKLGSLGLNDLMLGRSRALSTSDVNQLKESVKKRPVKK
jgi:23S rRNA pseudouridine2605 synthase